MKYIMLLLVVLTVSGCCLAPNENAVKPPEYQATPLLVDSLDDWEKINFGGEGEVYFKDGALNIDSGQPLTGLLYKGDLQALLGQSKENYAITLEAQRVEGVDMFLGLTFPVGEAGHVSLVLGGWAGAITGISNLDGLNASENETTQYHAFDDKKWYRVKVQVTPDKIQCWLEDKQIVDVNRADYTKYTTHGAVQDTVPLGIFTYSTWGAYRDVKVWKVR